MYHCSVYVCVLLHVQTAGYPSDGIVQVEEEEEDNETDAVEYRGVTVSTSPLAKRELNSQARPKSSRGFSTFPQPAISVGGKSHVFSCY